MKLIKRVNFVLILFLFFSYPLLAQTQAIILSDTASGIREIGSEVYLYEDKSAQMSFEEILKHDALFEKSKESVPNYGVTKSIIWVRFDIQNHTNSQWMLSLGYPAVDTVSLYCPIDGHYEMKRTGWGFPASQRDLKAADLIFSLPNTPKDTLLHYYMKVEGRIIILPIILGKTADIKEVENTNALYYLFYLGLVAMLFFYNLAIYITSREREYLYYSTWVFFTILFFMIFKGYSSLMIPEQLNFIIRHSNFVSSLGGISIVLFVKETLRLKEFLPKMVKWFNILIGAYCVIIFCTIFQFFQLASNLSQLILMLTVFLGLTAGILMNRKGHTFARFYTYGFIVTLITMSIFILIFQHVFPFNIFTSNAIVVGSGIEMILFSFGLGAKIKSINREKLEAQHLAYDALKEKEQIITQQNELLAIKVKERTLQLETEKKKSDDLLLNILPGEVAEELKLKGSAEAKLYDNVTVLFTDFVNFTGISESLSPTALVSEIHICFKAFDEIMERHGLEKIKTIGDAYLAVCGLPNSNINHAKNTLNAAQEIMRFMGERKQQGGVFDIRIGINTGAVVAGIVGIKKYAYDIWGDTVNVANRMESNSESGRINVSGSTYEFVKNDFEFIYRGKIEVKNKGGIDMYFVK